MLPANLMRPQSNSSADASASNALKRRPVGHLALALAFMLLIPSCKATKEQTDGTPVSAAPVTDQLPPLTLTDDTPDLLLTWIDDQGDFHVALKPSEVPEASREKVRVVVTTREQGTGKRVYVADLREKDSSGGYKVSTVTRAQWDELGADRRKVRLEALAPKAAPAASVGALDEAQPQAGKVTAIIYGADWCNPCHQAEKLLKGLGVDVTKKDIEKSPAARAEMQKRLAKAGRVGASIPVIDVAGKLFVGYSPAALKQAVKRARRPETL